MRNPRNPIQLLILHVSHLTTSDESAQVLITKTRRFLDLDCACSYKLSLLGITALVRYFATPPEWRSKRSTILFRAGYSHVPSWGFPENAMVFKNRIATTRVVTTSSRKAGSRAAPSGKAGSGLWRTVEPIQGCLAQDSGGGPRLWPRFLFQKWGKIVKGPAFVI